MKQTGSKPAAIGKEGGAAVEEITLDAVTGNLGRITDWVNSALDTYGCPARARMQIDVAIDEIFSNIARYAYPGKTGRATVRCDYADGLVSITFTDDGISYNPLEKQDPDTTLPAAEREIGGLGIFLVKKTMDAMEYQRLNGCNILTIRKKING